MTRLAEYEALLNGHARRLSPSERKHERQRKCISCYLCTVLNSCAGAMFRERKGSWHFFFFADEKKRILVGATKSFVRRQVTTSIKGVSSAEVQSRIKYAVFFFTRTFVRHKYIRAWCTLLFGKKKDAVTRIWTVTNLIPVAQLKPPNDFMLLCFQKTISDVIFRTTEKQTYRHSKSIEHV